jgi:hypothetical protein
MQKPKHLASATAGVAVLLAGSMAVTAFAVPDGPPAHGAPARYEAGAAVVRSGPAAASAASRDVNPVAAKAQVTALTADWRGARFPDGRPKVSDELLDRMKVVSIEQAWGYLKARDTRISSPVAGR